MTDEHDNRRSFRVSESVYLRYETLSDAEFEEGLQHRKMRLGENDGVQSLLVDVEARLSEAMYLLNTESDQVGKCITLLNAKINIVVEQLPGMRKTKSDLAKSPPQICDVGADGMVFATAERLAVDCKLTIQFLLSTDNRYVETFGRVLRATDPPHGNDSEALPYGVAVAFHGMKPSQREILIQHMFNRESETLRIRRMQNEAGE